MEKRIGRLHMLTKRLRRRLARGAVASETRCVVVIDLHVSDLVLAKEIDHRFGKVVANLGLSDV